MLVRRVEVLIAVVCCGVMFLLVGASFAGADEPVPECPAAATPYEGTDDLVHELRALRREAAAACAAQHADAIATRATLRTIGDEHAEALGEVIDAIENGGAEPVTGTVALSDDDRERADAMYAGIRNGLWFPVGVATALLVVAGFFWGARPDR